MYPLDSLVVYIYHVMCLGASTLYGMLLFFASCLQYVVAQSMLQNVISKIGNPAPTITL
jgi:hypothetical protein